MTPSGDPNRGNTRRTPPDEGDGVPSRTRPGPVVAWALWDWGSAAFNAVVTTFVFSVYLTSSGFGDADTTSWALSAGMALAGVVVALVAPVLGARSDRSGGTITWLAIHSLTVTVLIAVLWFVRPTPDHLLLGVALLALGNIVFEFASVTYNALLPEVSTPATVGRVSAFAWGAGYLGGIVLLLILVVGFVNPEVGWFGVTAADGLNIRAAMLVSALWFGVFAIPVLLVVRPRSREAVRQRHLGLIGAYKALWRTLSGLWRTSPDILTFLVASAVFRDGLAGVFTFGGVLAAGTFGFTPGEVIVFGIAANVVAGLVTIASGVFDDRFGPKTVIVGSLVCMVMAGVGLFAFHNSGPALFWALGLLLAAFVGPAQSASRTFLTRLIPPGREGEIFGLYATTGRAASFLAPTAFGLSISLGSAVTDGPTQHFGVMGLVAVLAVGLLLLLPVRQPRSAPSGSSKR